MGLDAAAWLPEDEERVEEERGLAWDGEEGGDDEEDEKEQGEEEEDAMEEEREAEG